MILYLSHLKGESVPFISNNTLWEGVINWKEYKFIKVISVKLNETQLEELKKVGWLSFEVNHGSLSK